jgi:hypothetical protein
MVDYLWCESVAMMFFPPTLLSGEKMARALWNILSRARLSGRQSFLVLTDADDSVKSR